MIVDVTGFGWSGSGAVHDLLREYDDVHFASYEFDWEFTLLWMVDGIYDLEHKICEKHCRYSDSDKAISRFLHLVSALDSTPAMGYNKIFNGQFTQICKKYIDDLVQVKFEGRNFDEMMSRSFGERYYQFSKRYFGHGVVKKIIPFSDKMIIPNMHTINLSYNPDNFLERTQSLLDELLSYVRSNDKKPLVTDQVFPPDCPDLFFKYFTEPIKCIIVRRDPRDLYLLAKHAYNSLIPIPSSNVDDFILFYKKTIENTKLPNSAHLLNVRFEDLIYNYDETIKDIENFIGISSHVSKYEYFKPQNSINNTQLYNYYGDCKADISKIEESLTMSLFPFEKYNALEKRSSAVF